MPDNSWRNISVWEYQYPQEIAIGAATSRKIKYARQKKKRLPMQNKDKNSTCINISHKNPAFTKAEIWPG